ncbi:transcription elongation factor GreA [Nakamurella multipartita]|jgi:transcription elongation factor GreA|uniref:Transcription elongation factor GreA n=1 Tax=Nakamurella multipartita (strain ATCC 700099 / DSM 44233 / CIP 104796 / JCM 9543 / NBRC 105858 / Y-104) TaxID=479431 RepID=C8XKP8_NAKMY|nr:transcription elongation factor GreA [Nakamurella multipartita]ACV80705.1 transcription elongation factor GreA [Nakamurella multipartita DSM 44233]HOZ56754.1 transcription elongation factor GreA [Nakamurella multipartita]
MTGTGVTWLTQEAHDRLKHELDELVLHRPVIAAEINARREEGDLKENGGYHAARDEQAKQESRIRHLQELLRDAQVGVAPADDGVVEPGMVVTIAYDGDDDDKETFLLGSREEGVHGSMPVYSPQSPLGQAILGASRGESREYTLPNGRTQKVSVVEAKPFTG